MVFLVRHQIPKFAVASTAWRVAAAIPPASRVASSEQHQMHQTTTKEATIRTTLAFQVESLVRHPLLRLPLLPGPHPGRALLEVVPPTKGNSLVITAPPSMATPRWKAC